MIRGCAEELNKRLFDARIDKIYMPSKDKIVMTVKNGRESLKVLLEAGNIGRVHITEQKFENPDVPPMFCMLLRKHLTSGRITAVKQPGFERMMDISVLSADEMGDITEKHIYIEMMGRRNNIIFAGSDGRIMGCIKKIDLEMSPDRPVLPGLLYELPPKQDKMDFMESTAEQIRDVLPEDLSPKMITDRVAGISPAVAKEICFLKEKYNRDPVEQIEELKDRVKNGDFTPYLIKKSDGSMDYSAMYFEHLEGAEFVKADSFSALLDGFYAEKTAAEQRKNASAELLRMIYTARDRQIRKLFNQENELLTACKREDIKKKADLIMSNIHLLEKGMKEAVICDYFTEGTPWITIELDEQKSPQQNAQRLYDNYGRLKNAETMLKEQIENGRKELDYIESVCAALEKAENSRDIDAIKEELIESGYIKKRDKNNKKPRKNTINPRKFRSENGFVILCGRNNIENDALTMRQADKRDIWFHSKNIPGSHVILETEGREPSDRDIEQAAAVAAYYSKNPEGTLCAIDYTAVKYVKKIAGGKPGAVTYSNFKTAYVLPELPKEE